MNSVVKESNDYLINVASHFQWFIIYNLANRHWVAYLLNSKVVQTDMNASFSFSCLDKTESFNSNWKNAQNLYSHKGSNVKGETGPFGFFTLASKNLEEFTPVFFKIFKGPNKHIVLMCVDASRLVCVIIKIFVVSSRVCSNLVLHFWTALLWI